MGKNELCIWKVPEIYCQMGELRHKYPHAVYPKFRGGTVHQFLDVRSLPSHLSGWMDLSQWTCFIDIILICLIFLGYSSSTLSFLLVISFTSKSSFKGQIPTAWEDGVCEARTIILCLVPGSQSPECQWWLNCLASPNHASTHLLTSASVFLCIALFYSSSSRSLLWSGSEMLFPKPTC